MTFAAVALLLIVPAILSAKILPAQTRTPQTIEPKQLQEAVTSPAQPLQSDPEAIAVQTPASAATTWPANQPARPARVNWDGRGLEIVASNSSLNEILREVAAATGAKLEGLTQDQRIFGIYGPGSGSDVLLKLLDGSGYNVLMIGDRDTDVLREIVLSVRSPVSPRTSANRQSRSNLVSDEASDRREPEPRPGSPPVPLASQSPFGYGVPPQDPLQLMQDILQRQQKIDQQKQQQDASQQ